MRSRIHPSNAGRILPQRFAATFRAIAAATLIACVSLSASADTRVLPDGQQPNDVRLSPLKDLNGYFPFEVPASRGEWEARAEQLRRRVLVATGLWPMPDKTPLNPVIHGRVERDGFIVEKAYFESVPGHYVTGLLFRPEGEGKNRPAVLCPHGHGGRLQDHGPKKIKELIKSGDEKFEGSGRFPKLARCAQLARMGCVVYIFDMLGYADSVQISYQLAHRFAKQRPDFESKDSWGLFSTQAELRAQSIMGLQTWNSIRALDFLCQLPDVDASRVGVTGGSGGGTQTILLCAIDPRPIVAFPNGMVSTAMQGGCTCENCSLLRIGTGNVELTALFAPKPQGMTAANDWTKEMMTKGFPQLQQLYAMLGADDNVLCEPMLHFNHNYNYVTRAIMYALFNRHLELGSDDPIVEQDYRPLTAEEYTVWNDDHPKPAGGDEYERSLTKYLAETSDAQIAALTPLDSNGVSEFRRVIGGAVETIIGRGLPEHDDVQRTKVDKQKHAGYLYFEDMLRLTTHEEELPIVSLYPVSTEWNGQVVIWVDGGGKDALFDQNGVLKATVRRLVDGGVSVLSADLFGQGEFLSGQPVTETRTVANKREFAGYSFCYNHPLFAHRVHDILTLIAFVRGDEHGPKQVNLIGTGGAGPLVAAARAIAGDAVDRCAVDTGGFRFADLKSYRDPNFLPAIVKYGDLPAVLALSAPRELWIGGDQGKVSQIVARTYAATGAKNQVTSSERLDVTDAAVDWLLTQ